MIDSSQSYFLFLTSLGQLELEVLLASLKTETNISISKSWGSL